MQLETIKKAIREWRILRQSKKASTDLLGQGSLFHIDVKKVLEVSSRIDPIDPTYIHAYLGVHEGKLLFFLMNNIMDSEIEFTKEGKRIEDFIVVEEAIYMDQDQFAPFITTSQSRYFNSTDAIPSNEAITRIIHWSVLKNKWINSAITTPNGLFEAFVIPSVDLEKETEVFALFGLKKKKPGQYPEAELIIWNETKGFLLSNPEVESSFEDIVRPVPPFGQGITAIKNFHLMQVSELSRSVTL
ncbi:hypothetical protein [Aquimarina algicola]|uniref:Uncharacterized protein n=1 Tax=Aquimarina algicola TaxID=2589995 RepID=A0A504J6F5_9FLAO|nr:hypothetical protein [Aquimarina algicola]TPN81741.1 hypothetical protein FHK87_24400 [Aquimarina algicola]